MTLLFLLALAILGFVMTLVARLALGNASRTDPAFLLSPILSPNALSRSRPCSKLPRLLRITLLLLGVTALGYWAYWSLVRARPVDELLLNYLAAPILLLVSELVAFVITLLWLPSGRLLPALHDDPWRARGVTDFWGRRWNLWFRDWFRYAIFTRLRRRPRLALVLVFAISGLMHEWVLNVPLYCVSGRNLFGTMMVYFLLQAAGVLFERRCLKSFPRAKILLFWLIVVIPSPLVLNEGLLRTLYLWPERSETRGRKQRSTVPNCLLRQAGVLPSAPLWISQKKFRSGARSPSSRIRMRARRR